MLLKEREPHAARVGEQLRTAIRELVAAHAAYVEERSAFDAILRHAPDISPAADGVASSYPLADELRWLEKAWRMGDAPPDPRPTFAGMRAQRPLTPDAQRPQREVAHAAP